MKIESARAPIIKFTLDGLSFDLSFASLEQDKIDNFENELYNEEEMMQLDDKTITAISGYMTNKHIMQTVPS
jgi:poly(A) polymerase Pap1